MRNEISKLKYLHSFSFIDDNKADKGETSNQLNINLLIFYFYFYLLALN